MQDGQEQFEDKAAGGVMFGAEASTWLFRYGLLTGGLSIRYPVQRTLVPRTDGDQVLWVHGPRLVPAIGLAGTNDLAPGVPGGARVGFLGLEFPLGITLAEGYSSAFTLGAALRIQLTL